MISDFPIIVYKEKYFIKHKYFPYKLMYFPIYRHQQNIINIQLRNLIILLIMSFLLCHGITT
jgi:hypothetical protein